MSLCIIIHFIYFKGNYFMDFIDSYGDVLDIVLRASLWTDMYRSRIVGLLCTPVVGGVAGVSTTMVG